MKTYSSKPQSVTRTWHFFNAENMRLGRLASDIAKILIGKHKTTYAPHVDTADHIVVINAAKVSVSGKKETQKLYHRHSGYPGGMTVTTLEQVRASKPEHIITHAVSGMLPKNRLQDKRLKHLHVYAGEAHPYEKQFKQS